MHHAHILCVRHDKTHYTGELPDLTPEGIAHMREVAEGVVRPWATALQVTAHDIDILSSSAPRALGSAMTVLERLGWSGPPTVEDGVGPMLWRDAARCQAALGGLKGRGYIDYETEPMFADPTLFETPSEIRLRLYGFLARLCQQYARAGVARPRVIFTHYEVLCHLTHDLFDIIASEHTALRYGEHVELTLSYLTDSEVLLWGRFRGQEIRAWFDFYRLDIRPA